MLGYRDRGQQSPNTDNAKIRLYTKSSRLRLLLLTWLRRRKTREEKPDKKKPEKKKPEKKKRKGAKARGRKE